MLIQHPCSVSLKCEIEGILFSNKIAMRNVFPIIIQRASTEDNTALRLCCDHVGGLKAPLCGAPLENVSCVHKCTRVYSFDTSYVNKNIVDNVLVFFTDINCLDRFVFIIHFCCHVLVKSMSLHT